jgi:thioredoxin-related protein
MKRFILLLTLTATLLFSNQKMTLLYLEMEHCGWCKKMDREVFENKLILKELKNLYNIKMMKKGDKDIPLNLTSKYYPTTFIISNDGKKIIDELPGYMKADDYLDYLKTLQEVESQN